jgi:chromosomal replication initiation ATPase DnaA
MILPEQSIYEVVTKVTGITMEQMQSKKRIQPIADARTLLRYFMNIYCDLNYSEIGRATKCDHSTVIHSINKVRNIKQGAKGYDKLMDNYNLCTDLFERFRRKYRHYYTLPNPNPSFNDRRS